MCLGLPVIYLMSVVTVYCPLLIGTCLLSGSVVWWLTVRTQHKDCQFESCMCHHKNAIDGGRQWEIT